MKKYIKPTMAIANIENEIILSGSVLDYNSTPVEAEDSRASYRDRAMFDWGAIIEGESDDE